MDQSAKHQALDFGSGHDLAVHGIEPCVELCTDRVEPAWDSFSPSLSAPPLLTLSLFLKINKHLKIYKVVISVNDILKYLQQL